MNWNNVRICEIITISKSGTGTFTEMAYVAVVCVGNFFFVSVKSPQFAKCQKINKSKSAEEGQQDISQKNFKNVPKNYSLENGEDYGIFQIELLQCHVIVWLNRPMHNTDCG